jgi:hypothetical protein
VSTNPSHKENTYMLRNRWMARVLIAAVAAATMLGANAAAAQAASGQADPQTLAIAFTVSDGESPESYLFEDPNCPPDIICKPQRVQAFISFAISTNASLCCQDLTVEYETVSGTAISNIDFCPTSGTARFKPGVFVQYVKVCIKFNTAIEPTETFTLRLKNPNVPAGVADVGVGTIYDGTEHVF